MGLALDAASSTKTTTPLGSLSRQIYQLMCKHGYAGKDFSSVFKFIEKPELLYYGVATCTGIEEFEGYSNFKV